MSDQLLSEKELKKQQKEQEKEAKKLQRNIEKTARELRRLLLEYAREAQFALAVATAVPLYWNEYYTVDTAEEMDMNESFRFFDWFTYDYIIEDDQRLIDFFVEEKAAELTELQKELIAAWRDAPPSGAYVFLDFDPFTQQFKLRDFFGDEEGEELTVYTTAGVGNAKPGDLILMRPVPVGNRLEFSVLGAYIPQTEIEDLPANLAAAREAYSAENPTATAVDFLRAHNHLIVHHALAQSEAQGRYPVVRLDPKRIDNKARAAAQKAAKKIKKRISRR